MKRGFCVAAPCATGAGRVTPEVVVASAGKMLLIAHVYWIVRKVSALVYPIILLLSTRFLLFSLVFIIYCTFEQYAREKLIY